jgi:hypothetical protein
LSIFVYNWSRSVFTFVQSWRSIWIPLKMTYSSIISGRILPILLGSFVATLKQIGFGMIGTRERTQYFLVDMLHLIQCLKIHLSLFCYHLDALFETSSGFGESAALFSGESKISIGRMVEVSVGSIPLLGFLR